jgi:hypothetical protein
MFDQLFKLLGIMPIPLGSGEPVDHTSVNIDADVEFDAVFSATVSFDPDVVPGAAVMSAESGAVDSDVHLFPSEKPGDHVNHLAYVDDRETFHPSLDHAMPWEHGVVLFEGFAVFDVCFNTIVGLIESYFEETSYCDGLWVMSFSSFFVGFPRWWYLVYRFDYRLGEISGEVAVHMVRNFWIYPFLCASHPRKR